MRPDLYVSHVPSDTEVVSLVVDFFEASVPGIEGHVACTSLPGYAAGPDAVGAATVIGIVDGWMPEDVANELLLAADAADQVVILILRGGPAVEVPDALLRFQQLEVHDGVLSMLTEDLTHAVAARLQRSGAAVEARDELLAQAARISSVPPAPLRAVIDATLSHAPGTPSDSQQTAYRVFGVPPESVLPPIGSTPDDTPPSDSIATGGGPQRTSSLVPKPRGPSALLSVSAGCALSDAAFNGIMGDADLVVLDGEFAEFLHGLGGDWFQLRSIDAQGLARVVDRLVSALPAARTAIGHWYDAGYQLTLFCCLCARETSHDVAVQSQLAQARDRAWNAFWHAATHVALPDHTVTALSALLEDVDAPNGARVEVAQCFEVLRNAAFDWDRVPNVERSPIAAS